VTFRSLAALVFCGGSATLVAALGLLGDAPGVPPEARHLRELKQRAAAPARLEPLTIADFRALPHGLALAARAPFEARGVSVEGWVQRTMLAGDGDLHLEIAPAPRGPDGPDTVYVTAEITPGWREAAPGWRPEALAELFRPNRGGVTPWDSGPRRVRVSGWLLYDEPYDRRPSPWTIEHRAPRVTGWEIHPVTKLERWDDARSAWVEVAR
jgi:hypothetical protein